VLATAYGLNIKYASVGIQDIRSYSVMYSHKLSYDEIRSAYGLFALDAPLSADDSIVQSQSRTWQRWQSVDSQPVISQSQTFSTVIPFDVLLLNHTYSFKVVAFSSNEHERYTSHIVDQVSLPDMYVKQSLSAIVGSNWIALSWQAPDIALTLNSTLLLGYLVNLRYDGHTDSSFNDSTAALMRTFHGSFMLPPTSTGINISAVSTTASVAALGRSIFPATHYIVTVVVMSYSDIPYDVLSGHVVTQVASPRSELVMSVTQTYGISVQLQLSALFDTNGMLQSIACVSKSQYRAESDITSTIEINADTFDSRHPDPITISPLLPDTAYSIQCRVLNAAGASDWSLPVTARTKAIKP
jgi:hypothetical protein